MDVFLKHRTDDPVVRYALRAGLCVFSLLPTVVSPGFNSGPALNPESSCFWTNSLVILQGYGTGWTTRARGVTKLYTAWRTPSYTWDSFWGSRLPLPLPPFLNDDRKKVLGGLAAHTASCPLSVIHVFARSFHVLLNTVLV